MALTKTLGSAVGHRPLWLLILASIELGSIVLMHLFHCRDKKSNLLLHGPLALCLGLLFTQYVLATQDINAAHLTIIINAFTVAVNSWILTIWARSMRRCSGECKVEVICFIIFGLALLFMLLSIATWAGAIYINQKFTSPYDDCDNCKIIDVMPIICHAALSISIAVNLSQVCLTFIFLCFSYQEHRQGRRLLGYLLLSSLLLLLSNFGILFDIQLLNVIPYWLSSRVFKLMCGPVTHLIQEEKQR
jgi:hypothetical protein